MTKIIGRPAGYAQSVPLKIVIREDIPYRSPDVGISAGIYEGVWNGSDWGLNVTMPRFDQPDAIPFGMTHVFISRTDTGAVVAKYDYTPTEWAETSAGKFDLARATAVRSWLRTQELADLTTNAQQATQDVQQATADASAALTAAESAVVAAEAAQTQAEGAITTLNNTVTTAAQQAAAGTVARVDSTISALKNNVSAGLSIVQQSVAETEQARLALLNTSTDNLQRYATQAELEAAMPADGTWAWAADSGNYAYRENGGWTIFSKSNPIITPAFFGLHFGENTNPNYSLGFGLVRLWDVGVNWRDLEKSPSQYDWTRLDSLISRYEAKGLELFLTLGQAPDWATGGAFGGDSALYNTKAPDLTMWRAHCAAMAQHLMRNGKPRVKYIEPWNEPAGINFWSGTPDEMVEVCRVAYEEFKKVSPDFIIVGPSAQGEMDAHGPVYLDKLLSLGMGQFFDVMGVHLYVSGWQEPEFRIQAAQMYRSMLAKYGLGHKLLLDGEAGYMASRQFSGAVGWETFTGDQAIAYTLRHHLSGLAAGLLGTSIYTANGGFGSIRLQDDAGNLTAAGEAYRAFVNDVVGAQVVNYDVHDGIHALTLTKNSVEIVYMWTADRNAARFPLGADLIPAPIAGIPAPETVWSNGPVISPIPARFLRHPNVNRSLNTRAALAAAGEARQIASLNPTLYGGANEWPRGWHANGDAFLQDYTGSLVGGKPGRPVTLASANAYAGMGQNVSEWLRPGEEYKIRVEYATDGDDEWTVWG